MSKNLSEYLVAEVMGVESLKVFLEESNKIEGIPHGRISLEQLRLSRHFLSLEQIDTSDVVILATLFQPDAQLRDRFGLNVRVGDYVPPPGSPEIREQLREIIGYANKGAHDSEMAWRAHMNFERLHPFTDGNGRSGRMLWLWMMGGNAPLGFLHTWYYQSLRYGYRG